MHRGRAWLPMIRLESPAQRRQFHRSTAMSCSDDPRARGRQKADVNVSITSLRLVALVRVWRAVHKTARESSLKFDIVPLE